MKPREGVTEALLALLVESFDEQDRLGIGGNDVRENDAICDARLRSRILEQRTRSEPQLGGLVHRADQCQLESPCELSHLQQTLGAGWARVGPTAEPLPFDPRLFRSPRQRCVEPRLQRRLRKRVQCVLREPASLHAEAEELTNRRRPLLKGPNKDRAPLLVPFWIREVQERGFAELQRC